MTGPQHESVAEAFLGMANVPMEDATQQRDNQRIHFGTRSTRVAALTVVEDQVDELVDQILGFLPLVEMVSQLFIALGNQFCVSLFHEVTPFLYVIASSRQVSLCGR